MRRLLPGYDKNEECCHCCAVLYKHRLLCVRHQRQKGTPQHMAGAYGFAPVLIMDRVSTLAEALGLSSPLPHSSRVHKGRPHRCLCAHLDTHGDVLHTPKSGHTTLAQ